MVELVVEDKGQELHLVWQYFIEMLKVKLICPGLCQWRAINNFEL